MPDNVLKIPQLKQPFTGQGNLLPDIANKIANNLSVRREQDGHLPHNKPLQHAKKAEHNPRQHPDPSPVPLVPHLPLPRRPPLPQRLLLLQQSKPLKIRQLLLPLQEVVLCGV